MLFASKSSFDSPRALNDVSDAKKEATPATRAYIVDHDRLVSEHVVVLSHSNQSFVRVVFQECHAEVTGVTSASSSPKPWPSLAGSRK